MIYKNLNLNMSKTLEQDLFIDQQEDENFGTQEITNTNETPQTTETDKGTTLDSKFEE